LELSLVAGPGIWGETSLRSYPINFCDAPGEGATKRRKSAAFSEHRKRLRECFKYRHI
jgi:hypothetical protein